MDDLDVSLLIFLEDEESPEDVRNVWRQVAFAKGVLQKVHL